MDDPLFSGDTVVNSSTRTSFQFNAFGSQLLVSQSLILEQHIVDTLGADFDISGSTPTLKIRPKDDPDAAATVLATGVLSDSGGGTTDTVTFTVAKDIIPDIGANYPQKRQGNAIIYYELEDGDSFLEFQQDVNIVNSVGGTGEGSEGAPVITTTRMDLGSVEDTLAAPPTSVINEAYLVDVGATGVWSGKDNDIATGTGATGGWIFRTPIEGNFVYDKTADDQKRFNVTWAIDSDIVTSVHGRTGDVVSATGDYSNDQVTNLSSVAGTNTSDALDTLRGDDQTQQGEIDLNTAHRNTITGNPHVVTAADVGNTTAQWNADEIQGITVDDTNISNGRVLVYNSVGTKLEYQDPAAGSGIGSGVGITWLFSTTTTAADPGSGNFRANNATVASITEIYISATGNDGQDASKYINALGSGDSPFFQQLSDATKNFGLNVVSVVDNTGWFTITVTVDTAGTLIDNSAESGLTFNYTAGGGGASVTSVYGRTGGVIAVAGDYTSTLVTNSSVVAGAFVTDALDQLNSDVSGAAAETITISAGEGLSGGGDLSANRTLTLDIDGLAAEASPAGGDFLVIWDGANNKKVDWNDLPGAAGGEVNTSSNLGAGEGLATTKAGVDLPFKSLIGGTNVNLSSSGTEVTINSTAAGGTVTSVGSGTGLTGGPITASGNLAIDLTSVNNWTGQQYFGTDGLSDAANISWDLDDSQNASVTLAGNRTLDNPTNMKNGGKYEIRITQDGTGSRTLAYGTAYKWPGGTAPTLTTTASAVDIISFTSDGTSMFGVIAQDFS